MPAGPAWRKGNRDGERRSSLPVAHNGSTSRVTLEVTVKLAEPNYLMMLMRSGTGVFCRLCMTTGHFDRLTRTLINQAHFHSWEANRGKAKTIPKKLNHLELVPGEIAFKERAFNWFLQRNGIETPRWAPPKWPEGEELF